MQIKYGGDLLSIKSLLKTGFAIHYYGEMPAPLAALFDMQVLSSVRHMVACSDFWNRYFSETRTVVSDHAMLIWFGLWIWVAENLGRRVGSSSCVVPVCKLG